MAGLLLHGVLLLAYGAVPGRAVAQCCALALQGVLAASIWVFRYRLPSWFWPAITGTASLLVGTVPITYPHATLGVLSMLFVHVMFASRLLGRYAARALTMQAALVAAWVLYRVPLNDGQVVVNIFFATGALTLVHLTLVSATNEQFHLLAQLERTARVDGLTGLLTRAAFDDDRAGALRETSSTSLMVVDVDRFKTINDTYGHPAGDAVLRHICATLATGVRHDDAVVGRLGGDELAVLLRRCPDDVAWRRAQALAALIERTPVTLPDGTTVSVNVSIGIAHAARPDADHATPTALYDAADAALYRAKGNGRSRAERATARIVDGNA